MILLIGIVLVTIGMTGGSYLFVSADHASKLEDSFIWVAVVGVLCVLAAFGDFFARLVGVAP